MQIKLSDYLFGFLKQQGVKNIFMLPGGGAMHLVDSLGRSGITYTHFQHEQAAAIAAESYGQHTNEIGVALVTSGPGGTNTLTAVAAGWIDSTPMMIICGQAKRSDLIGDRGVRQIGNQEVSITEIARPITKYCVQILDPETARYHIERAYYEATHGRKGPVLIDVPMDVQACMIDPENQKGFSPEENIPVPSDETVKLIADKLEKAQRPIILAGNGIYTSGATDKLHELLALLKVPVQTTWKSVDLMWESHPLYAGHPGTLGDRGANFIIQKSDLLLSLGARLDNSITAFNEPKFATDAYKIVADIDQNELKKFTMKIDLPVLCNVSDLIDKLIKELSLRGKIDKKVWIKEARQIRKDNPTVLPSYSKDNKFVNGYYFTEQLSKQLKPHDVIVPESAGITAEVTIQSFKNKKGQKMKHAAGLGSMGFGLPYSIGACLANDKHRTILINGDGAFQLNIQELETLHRLNLPVKIFIWNNAGYGSIRAMQRNNFNGRYVASESKSGLTIPNISKVAKAYGFKTDVIKNNKEVESGIKRVLGTRGLVLCEVMINPDQMVQPKVASKMGENGKMIPGTLDNMWPFKD